VDYINQGRRRPFYELKIALHSVQPPITHDTVLRVVVAATDASFDHVGLVAMLIRLTHKLAERLDGIDLSHRSVDEIFDLSPHDAELLIAEGWATPVNELPSAAHRSPDKPGRTEAADGPGRSRARRK